MPDFPATFDPPPEQVTVTVDPPPEAATYSLDNTDLATICLFVGWDPADIDTICAIGCAEAKADLTATPPTIYADAVGDLNLVGPIWHGSMGWPQTRALRDVGTQYQSIDAYRAEGPILLDPIVAAVVALKLKNAYGWGIWSTYTDGSYKQYLGLRPKVITGHPNRSKWWV